MGLTLILGMIAVGIFFMVVEVYLLPGISIAGVAGVACIVGGVVLAFVQLGSTVGTWTLIATVVVLGAALYWFYRSKTFHKMALQTEIDSIPDPFNGGTIKPGDKGLTLTRLGPIGKVQFGETVVEGRSENEMIDANTPIEAVEVGSNNVTVRKHNS